MLGDNQGPEMIGIEAEVTIQGWQWSPCVEDLWEGSTTPACRAALVQSGYNAVQGRPDLVFGAVL